MPHFRMGPSQPEPLPGLGRGGAAGLGGCSLRGAGFGFEVGGWKGREGRLAAGVPAARHLRPVRSERPGRRFWTCSPGTSRISTTWEPVRPVPRPHPARLLNQKLRGGVCELFSQPSGRFWRGEVQPRPPRRHISRHTFG